MYINSCWGCEFQTFMKGITTATKMPEDSVMRNKKNKKTTKGKQADKQTTTLYLVPAN